MADNPPADLGAQTRPVGLEDEHLVERFAGGDRSAFDRIVAAHQARIARLVYRLLGWDEAVEDVVQEVFLSALRKRKAFRGGSSVGTWLTRIAINKCRSHARNRRLWRGLLQAVRGRTRSAPPPADCQAMQRETFHQVRRAVRDLPPACREVAVLRYLEEMPIEQVAEAVGVSRNVVEVRLHRARQRLKDSLAELVEE